MAAKDTSPVSTFLRKVNLGTYPFAFSLSIAYAASAPDGLFPAITLVPLTASFFFCAFVLRLDSRRRALQHQHDEFSAPGNDDKNRRVRNLVTCVGDTVLGGSLLTCMVFTWINLSEGGRCQGYYYCQWTSDLTVLGTYASVPFMVNMSIHFYFALLAIYASIPSSFFSLFTNPSSAPICPNCHHDLNAPQPSPHWLGTKSAGGYSILPAGENDSLYRDIERQTGGRDEGAAGTRPSEETAREIGEEDVSKIMDV